MRPAIFAEASFGLAASLMLVGCSHNAHRSHQKVAIAKLVDSGGAPVGVATLEIVDRQAVLRLDLRALPPSSKAIHIHGTGTCAPPDFVSAGGHLNPDGRAHGKLSPHGKHLGDLENITISGDGSAMTELLIATNAEEVLPQILDQDGAAVVIHAAPDDYSSQPAGAAGPRIACGILVSSDHD